MTLGFSGTPPSSDDELLHALSVSALTDMRTRSGVPRRLEDMSANVNLQIEKGQQQIVNNIQTTDVGLMTGRSGPDATNVRTAS
jgi:hypothetical protein